MDCLIVAMRCTLAFCGLLQSFVSLSDLSVFIQTTLFFLKYVNPFIFAILILLLICADFESIGRSTSIVQQYFTAICLELSALINRKPNYIYGVFIKHLTRFIWLRSNDCSIRVTTLVFLKKSQALLEKYGCPSKHFAFENTH